MKLNTAKICLDCETLFEGTQCPSCGGEVVFPLAKWLEPIEREHAIPEAVTNGKEAAAGKE